MANIERPRLTDGQRSVAEQFPAIVPQYNHDFTGRNVTLFGSFKGANFERMKQTRRTFEHLGFYTQAPRGERMTHTVEGFEILDADASKLHYMEQVLGRALEPGEVKRNLEMLFQIAMKTADISYLVPDDRGFADGGYMGLMASVELGIAMAADISVVAGVPVSSSLDERDGYDSFFGAYAGSLLVATPEEVAAVIDSGGRFVSHQGITKIEGLAA